MNTYLLMNMSTELPTRQTHAVKAFLQRNIKSCPLQVKEDCYRIMVRPIMEYACTVWSPHTKKNIQVLEAVATKKSSRFVNNDYSNFSSVTAMMQDLEWPTLEKRRWVIKVTNKSMLFKILNDIVCIPLTSI